MPIQSAAPPIRFDFEETYERGALRRVIIVNPLNPFFDREFTSSRDHS